MVEGDLLCAIRWASRKSKVLGLCGCGGGRGGDFTIDLESSFAHGKLNGDSAADIV